MDEKYERAILRLTAVSLIAAALVIPVEYVALGPSLALLVGYVLVGAALFGAARQFPEYRLYLDWLWLGPALAAGVVLVGMAIGATPGELQSLGGIVGLVGVANLLFRPIYRIVHYVLAGAVQIGREIQEERSS